MNRASTNTALAVSLLLVLNSLAAAARFEKVGDHCYFFQSRDETGNTAAVITEEGALLVNPPSGPGAPAALEAFKKLPSRPVRWILNTDYHLALTAGAARFVEQGALVLGSRQMFQLAAAAEAAQGEKKETKAADPSAPGSLSATRLVFEHQMRLFPGGVEIRIFAIDARAHTGADIVVFVPSEKVLMVGDLFIPGRYPEIDASPGEGSALGWLDGMKQAIDAVPLLKAAIPPKVAPPKTEAKPAEEKTLEETITVLPLHGPRSNLKEMKDLLEAALHLRSDLARLVSSGRDIDAFLNSSAVASYRSYENLDSFARQLHEALSKK